MNLANRYNFVLVPLVIVFGIWRVSMEWFEYKDHRDQSSKQFLALNQQELQILSFNDLFNKYFASRRQHQESIANDILVKIHALYQQVLKESHDRQLPLRLAFLDKDLQLLAEAIQTGALSSLSFTPNFELRVRPSGAEPSDLLPGNVHESMVPIGNDANRDGRIAGDEIQGYIYGAFQKPYDTTSALAWDHFLEGTYQFVLGLTLLVLILSWTLNRLASPIYTLINQLQSLMSVDQKSPIDEHWALQELQILASTIEAKRQFLQDTQAELLAGRDQALDEAQLTKRFLTTISNEISTPLDRIVEMMQQLQSGELESRQQQAVEIIKRSSEDLLQSVGDIIDCARIGEKEISPNDFEFDLWGLVLSIEEQFNLQLSKPNLQISVDIASNVPGKVLGDPVRLRQILVKLIANAIRFTESGQVTIRLTLIDTEAEQAHVEFAVEDTGCGINPEIQSRLLLPFAEQSRMNPGEDSGLGLAIHNHILQIMGSRIELESTPGIGSRFHFRIALRYAHVDLAVHSNQPVSGKAANPAILVAEDEEMNRLYMQGLLETRGFSDFQLVENGVAALTALEERHFDAIIMDCQMPLMDGFEATREIRRREAISSLDRPIVIIGLTGSASEEDRQLSLDAGMNDCLFKPLSGDDLQNNLVNLLKDV